jgi:twinkle protein
MTDVMEWLKQVRKLDEGLLLAMGVKAVQHPSLGQAVAFAYQRNGKPYGAKFRTVEKRFSSSVGVTRGLYNEDDLGRLFDLPVVICEGEIDCLSVMQSGFERAVSVPDGWTAQGNKIEALVAAEDLLRKSPFVIVAGDADEAGESLPRVIANILKGHDVRRAKWPDGCKDPNDVLVKHGEGALATCLNAATRIDPPGGHITGFSDLPPLSDRRVLRIGENPFDWAVALELGAMSVWTGTPGSGKSTFLTWAAERISVSEDIRVGIMAFETHPHTIRDQLSLIRTGRDFASLDGESRQRLLAHLDAKFRLVHVTMEDQAEQHLAWLETMVSTLALRDQCKLIIVDPWNELEHLPEKGESMTQYVNFATKFIRQMAERLEVHIALVAHPKKMPTEGHPRAPTGYDIADSAAFFNKPSLGLTVHQETRKDDDGNETSWVDLHVWKVRNTRLYKINKGKISLTFDQERMRYLRRRDDRQQGQA